MTAINEEASASVTATTVGASPHHQLKRATSCPDERQIRDRLAAVVGSGGGAQKLADSAVVNRSPRSPTVVTQKSHSPRGGSKETVTTSAQTDEFQVFPYEHLFPSVLPQWFVGSQGGVASQQNQQQQQQQQQQPGISIPDADVNPYDLLDVLINVSAAKGEPVDCTGIGQKVGPRLRESRPPVPLAARESSRNLGPIF